jgi:hypothetical protein
VSQKCGIVRRGIEQKKIEINTNLTQDLNVIVLYYIVCMFIMIIIIYILNGSFEDTTIVLIDTRSTYLVFDQLLLDTNYR